MAKRINGLRPFAGAALLALIAGCGTSSFHTATDLVKLVRKSRTHVDPTPASVAAKPYFQLQATSPEGRAVLILGGTEGNLQGWYGQGGQAVFIEHGEVVRTIGLRQNLDDTQWLSINPFVAGLQALTIPMDGIRVMDWSPGYRYGVTLHVRMTVAGMEDVTILGTVHRLRRVDERVDSPAADFAAENHYWVDPADGFIWKSHQVVAPGLSLDLIQLHPYRSATK